MSAGQNLLVYGDNLAVLSNPDYVASDSVDLVYLDPPFKSNKDYNVLFSRHGVRAAAQVKAFGDTWEWNAASARAYQETVERGGDVANALLAFRAVLGDTDMLAYLAMMAPRLVALRRVLKPTGSLFLHCDTTASHYLKVLLDAVFHPKNFRSEIIWKRTTSHGNVTGSFGNVTDSILYYAKADHPTWNQLWKPYSQAYIEQTFRFKDPDGRRYASENMRNMGYRPNLVYDFKGYKPHANGWGWSLEKMEEYDRQGRIVYPKSPGGRLRLKRYWDESRGERLQNLWDDIPAIGSRAGERLGYPTQKPLALMKRIIAAASNPGDVVLDPFCGCGTTIEAAQELGRRWIGIDITHLATGLIKSRLVEKYGPQVAATFRVRGEPTTVEDAAVLAKDDPFQFQAWALGLVGGRIATTSKRGGDGGVDGRLYFHTGLGGPSGRAVVSVKAGQRLAPALVRELVAVVLRDDADLGVLITLDSPTPGMHAAAMQAKFCYPGGPQRVQLRTIADLLSGRGIVYPSPVESQRTLWPPETIPAEKLRRRSRVVPPRPALRRPAGPAEESPLAATLRAGYARRTGEGAALPRSRTPRAAAARRPEPDATD